MNQTAFKFLLVLAIVSAANTAAPQEAASTDQEASATDSGMEAVAGSESEAASHEQEPEFNIDVLIERVKETGAMGVITKLSLKNKIDDFLENAEQVKLEPTGEKLEMLRSEFDGLLLKTVTLLNNGEDYALAEDIFDAREQLWESIMENKT